MTTSIDTPVNRFMPSFDLQMKDFLPNSNAKYELDMLEIMEGLIKDGVYKGDRTGTGTLSKLGNVLRVDISDNKAPLLFSKEIKFKSFLVETDWFLKGHTSIAYLKEFGVGIWDEWVIPETAVFRPYTEDEFYKAAAALNLAFDEGEDYEALRNASVMGYKDLFNWFRCTYNEKSELYKKWKKVKSGDPTRDELNDFLSNHGVTDIPNVKLIDGSIGVGAYGSLWRHWEDTRIVELREAQQFYDRGYKYVADVPLGANWKRGPGQQQKEYVVIHRDIDQIANVIAQLKTNPDSRRIIVTAWNPGRTEDAVLPPCHSLFSFWTRDLTVKELFDQLDLMHQSMWMNRQRGAENMLPHDDEGHTKYHKDLLEFIDLVNLGREDTLPYHKKALSCLLYMR